jgi:hypothetical protein
MDEKLGHTFKQMHSGVMKHSKQQKKEEAPSKHESLEESKSNDENTEIPAKDNEKLNTAITEFCEAHSATPFHPELFKVYLQDGGVQQHSTEEALSELAKMLLSTYPTIALCQSFFNQKSKSRKVRVAEKHRMKRKKQPFVPLLLERREAENNALSNPYAESTLKMPEKTCEFNVDGPQTDEISFTIGDTRWKFSGPDIRDIVFTTPSSKTTNSTTTTQETTTQSKVRISTCKTSTPAAPAPSSDVPHLPKAQPQIVSSPPFNDNEGNDGDDEKEEDEYDISDLISSQEGSLPKLNITYRDSK